MDTGLLGVDKACGLVQVIATHACSPGATGLCRRFLQECGVKACALCIRNNSQKKEIGIGAASGGQRCPKVPPSNPFSSAARGSGAGRTQIKMSHKK